MLYKATFHESGFSYDDYPIELAWTLRTTSSGGAGGVSSERGRASGTDKRPRLVSSTKTFDKLQNVKIFHYSITFEN